VTAQLQDHPLVVVVLHELLSGRHRAESQPHASGRQRGLSLTRERPEKEFRIALEEGGVGAGARQLPRHLDVPVAQQQRLRAHDARSSEPTGGLGGTVVILDREIECFLGDLGHGDVGTAPLLLLGRIEQQLNRVGRWLGRRRHHAERRHQFVNNRVGRSPVVEVFQVRQGLGKGADLEQDRDERSVLVRRVGELHGAALGSCPLRRQECGRQTQDHDARPLDSILDGQWDGAADGNYRVVQPHSDSARRQHVREAANP